MPELLPPVDVVVALHARVALQDDVVEATHRSQAGECGLELAERLDGAAGRMCSSWSSRVTPLMSVTGITDLAK